MCNAGPLLALKPAEFQNTLRSLDSIPLSPTVLCDLLSRLVDLLIREPNVVYLTASSGPIIVCGDIHGQLLDLFQLFEKTDILTDNASQHILFLGDYVDRGHSSIETFAFLAYLKCKFPDRVTLLRGNHESRAVSQQYGLYNDCDAVYSNTGMWESLNHAFDYLPIAAVIDNRIFCVHGGLSPKITLIEQINSLNRVREIGEDEIGDLTWSDPEEITTWCPNTRGKGFIFGATQVRQFLHNNRMRIEGTTPNDPRHAFIARAHQVAMTGYEWKLDDGLVIVWSAPNYSYKTGNAAAVMKVAQESAVEFLPFEKDEKSHEKPRHVFSEYFV
jgi:diadenosine tetraphosphatase ApaH/serine/threonine PP2A family protein phosphatase